MQNPNHIGYKDATLHKFSNCVQCIDRQKIHILTTKSRDKNALVNIFDSPFISSISHFHFTVSKVYYP